jgi:hypothetical protein
MEMSLLLAHNIHAPYYALSIVGPTAMAIQIWMNSRGQQVTPSARPVAPVTV